MTKSRDFDARQGVARHGRKCDRAYRTLRRGASHSRATRFLNRARCSILCHFDARQSRAARQNRKCDIGLSTARFHKACKFSRAICFARCSSITSVCVLGLKSELCFTSRNPSDV